MAYDFSELLEHAAEEGFNIPCFKEDGSVDLLAKSSCGDTLLHVAVARREPEAIRYLLRAGLDINAQGDYFETPLFFSAAQGDIATSRLLLELGADPNIPDHRGDFPSSETLKKVAEQGAASDR